MKDLKSVSVASLPGEFQISDPFDREFLRSLPKETLVNMILKFHKDYIASQPGVKADTCLCGNPVHTGNFCFD